MATITIADPTTALTPAASTAGGELIEGIKDECGFALRLVNDIVTACHGPDLLGMFWERSVATSTASTMSG
ncbi:hypothetical protein ACQP1U_05660 [Actinomycetota bacterium]